MCRVAVSRWVVSLLVVCVLTTGIRTAMTDSSGTTRWGDDLLDRLTSATYPNGDAVGDDDDAVGNRTSLTINGVTTTNTFDAADRLLTSGGANYGYDTNGNLTSKTDAGVTTTYRWDSLNRLTGVSDSSGLAASYASNGDGLRTRATVNGTTTSFTWDPTGLGTVLSDGNQYIWGQGLVGRIDAGGTATFAHADGLGSLRLVTDGLGAVVGTSAYDAFGAGRTATGVQYRFGFTGRATGYRVWSHHPSSAPALMPTHSPPRLECSRSPSRGAPGTRIREERGARDE